MSTRLERGEIFRQQLQEPISEDRDSVSFLGVRLPKAMNRSGILVPSRESLAEYIYDRISLGLERDAAVAFAINEPVFIEGGTAIGKSMALKEMCWRLGWEHLYINLTPGTDETKLMGKAMPNTIRKSMLEPEYYFWLGKVASAVVPEEGKIKLLVLDEIGNAPPASLTGLHEVLDAVREKRSVIDLREWGGEIVDIDPEKIKIAACANPPGGKYVGKNILDPGLFRRFMYIKAPDELPEDIFESRTKAMYGLAPRMWEMPEREFCHSREKPLTVEELCAIEGVDKLVESYTDFHTHAKNLLAVRRIGADQPQPFEFEGMIDPRRVRDFIKLFYNGNILETFMSAVRYVYLNKVESELDKAQLEDGINMKFCLDSDIVSRRRPLREASRDITGNGAGGERGGAINRIAHVD